MGTFQDIAQLLVSSWALAQPDESRIPVSHGAFDRVLKKVFDEGLLPSWASDGLHFSDTRVGMRCVELPDILEWAQLGELTSAPNPTYRYAEVQVNENTAAKLVRWLDVPEDQARHLGRRMKELIDTEARLTFSD
jgi:hypothetical protein